MILADTSAWIEYLRATGSRANLRLRELITDDADLCVTEVVVLEVLAGATDEAHAHRLTRFLDRFEHLHTESRFDHLEAARLYRTCRRAGSTIRSLNDCLIAAIAIRAGASVLHADRDFTALALHAGLRLDN